MCDLMTASVRIGLRWSKDYGKDVCCPRCCSTLFFAAVLNVVLQRFSEEPAILAELVHLKEPSTSMGPEPAMDYVRRAVWGMLYADDACIVSRSPQGLAKMMEVIVEVCRSFGLTVSAKKTETMCVPPPRTPRTMVRIEPAAQSTNRYNPSPT